jgi:exodeoxyribonuclease V alpha subunit
MLSHTWRYAPGSGIEALARAVNAGDADRALEVLQGEAWPDVTLLDVPASEVASTLEELVLDAYVGVAESQTALEALERLRSVRVLGAHRSGFLGVTELNAHLEGRVREALGIDAGVDWYAGRPVMVTRNDHDLRLYNGDVGVVFGEPGSPDALRVWFETADGQGRAVGSALLPEHDTVFATTVHKSQGSEYAHVVLVLPSEVSPVMTRELLYTAVTRASRRVTVLGPEAVVAAASQNRTRRMSRLRNAIQYGGR